MSTLIFDPMLPTLGGGERYIFSLAKALADHDDVVIASPDVPSVATLESFGFDTSIRRERLPYAEFTRATRDVERAVVLTNVVPPRSHAPTSFAVVQFPFVKLGETGGRLQLVKDLAKLSRYRCLVYSEYSRRWLRRRWLQRGRVLPPPVDIGCYDIQSKRKLIVAVGRFFVGQHSKRHDVLIDVFRSLPAATQSEWRLVLAGGIKDDPADAAHLEMLKARAAGMRIEFRVNIPAAELMDLYRDASLFWHATGFGRHSRDPEKAEHFGMTTVEAMSWGVVPLVYADGGQLEVVTPDTGVLWGAPEELGAATVRLAADGARRHQLATAAQAASQRYDFEHFRTRVRDVFHVSVGTG